MVIPTLYFALPGFIANMVPIFVRNHFKWLDVPVDFNRKFRGRPLFGSHKTYRGFIFGVLAAILTSYLQSLLFYKGFFHSMTLVDYNAVSYLTLGIALGFGALFGDLVKSFIKRRVGVNPGKPFIPWDQIDYIIGMIAFSIVFIPIETRTIIILLIAGPLLHISVSRIGYYLKIRKEKW